jgi:hypothetical protein
VAKATSDLGTAAAQSLFTLLNSVSRKQWWHRMAACNPPENGLFHLKINHRTKKRFWSCLIV